LRSVWFSSLRKGVSECSNLKPSFDRKKNGFIVMNSYRIAFLVFFILAFSASFQSVVLAHSGKLNAQGCHSGSQPFHCHRRPAQPFQAQPPGSSTTRKHELISGQRGRDQDPAGHAGHRPAALPDRARHPGG
jgi:hypothetical protein